MNVHAQTTNGEVRGRERKGVALFAGIPYAAPPTGVRRWAPPEPSEPWDGVRDATRFGPAAPQLPGEGLTNAVELAWAEDCLTLNVVTPAVDDGRRPVLVWIHGGAYRHGTGATPWYDGSSFAADGGIVVVTINYRLGALGFCQIDGAPTSGLNGILDQVAALHWVRDNIAAFGGDPDSVTIAGESAGGFSVATLTAMTSTNGLFRRAIAQSGAGHHVVMADLGATVAQRFLDELGAHDLADARRRSALDVLEAQGRVEARAAEFMNTASLPFGPVVGGEHLPERPIDLMAAGAGADVAMLTGTNADEMTLFGMGQVRDDELVRVLERYADPLEPLLDTYRASMPAASPGELAVALTGDWNFRIPAVRMAEAREAHDAATWMYLFDWKSHAFDGALGATHALEIPFAFNTLHAPGADVFLGTPDPPQHVADAMHRSWQAFITTGRPHHDALPPWPAYRSEHRAVLEFSDHTRVLVDPDAPIRQAWAGLR